MSTDREVTRIVRSWLEEGVTALPDRVLDAVLDQVPATRQRRAWWPAWRLPHMNVSMRVAGAAVAVAVLAAIVIAVVGFNARPSSSVGGGPPTPSPTPAPTLPAGQVPPGTYRADIGSGAPVVTYTLPAGWATDPSGPSGQATILKGGSADPPSGMAVDLWQIAQVYNDPCHWNTTSTSSTFGPTVDDMVAAFAAQKRSSPVTPVDVTIDGYHGKQIDLIVPLDVNIAACDQSQYTSWLDPSGGQRYNQGPGQHDLLDILAVNGKSFVILRAFYAANSAADLAELQAIVDSIKLTP